jgi:hypothetical protein
MAPRRSLHWLVPLLVAVSLCYAQAGFFLRFEAQRVAIKRAIKDRIRKGVPREELTPFVMPLHEWEALLWIKPKREFRLPSGAMYDVVHITITDGMVDALCIHDVAETHLFAGLDAHVKGLLDGPGDRQGARKRVASFLFQLDLPPPPMAALAVPSKARCMHSYAEVRLCGHVPLSIPPPRG